MENKKKIWIIVAIVVIIGLLVWWGIAQKTSNKKVEPVGPSGTEEPAAPIVTAPGEKAPEAEKPKPIETALGEFDVKMPEQTMPLAPDKIEEVTKTGEAIKLTIADNFSPSEFTVTAGQIVSLILEAPNATHTFGFESPELSNIYMGVALGESRGLSFIAPSKPGDYKFMCTQPGHKERGEVGVMHVK